jgi:hypothetical protein
MILGFQQEGCIFLVIPSAQKELCELILTRGGSPATGTGKLSEAAYGEHKEKLQAVIRQVRRHHKFEQAPERLR